MNPTNEREIGPAVARNLRLFDAELRGHTADIGALDTRIDALEADTGWVAATLLNSWVDYNAAVFGPARYRRIGNTVYVRGLIKDGTNGVAALNLPAGFRPAHEIVLASISNPNAAARLDVEADGDVVIYIAGGSNAYMSITCSFPLG